MQKVNRYRKTLLEESKDSSPICELIPDEREEDTTFIN